MMGQNISRYILFINHECKMDLCLCIQVLRLGKDYLLFEIIMREHYHNISIIISVIMIIWLSHWRSQRDNIKKIINNTITSKTNFGVIMMIQL